MTAPLLALHNVVKRFGGLVAVDGLSFEVAEHQVLGLIGPNGSGKTTVINLISGTLRPTAGRIELQGRPIAGLPAREISRRGIGRTFQLVRLLPSLSVLDNVVAGAAFGHRRLWGGEAREHAAALLARVGLAAAPDAPIDTLTYIDQKRLELARALAADPILLLLDEWLAGLNPTELGVGVALIDSLRAEGRTIVLVEHVMHAIRSLCDVCVVMNSGAGIAHGRPAEVLADPAVIHAYLGDDDA